MQTFKSPDTGLKLSYSASLSRENIATVHTLGEFAVFVPPASVSTAEGCNTVVLALGSGIDKLIDTKHKVKVVEHVESDPKGTVTLSEFKRTCFDKDALDDSILTELVGTNLKVPGMHTLAHTGNSLVGSTTVWWAAAAGYGRDANGKRSPYAGTVITGTAAAMVDGHVMLWSISANDPATFNRLMNISACFSEAECKGGFIKLSNFQLNAPANIASR
jgi:hypothetical protein